MLIHIEAAILKVFWLVPPNTWKNLVLAFYYSNVLRRCSQNFDLSFHEELSTHSNYHFRKGFVKSDCGFLKKLIIGLPLWETLSWLVTQEKSSIAGHSPFDSSLSIHFLFCQMIQNNVFWHCANEWYIQNLPCKTIQ